ncbi:MAG: hypothetical protein LBP53_06265 [Candidatus Peribacteria bacterium]|nr:hypothetical protein [Candidatus Peribacteria bacterium]
MFKSSENGKQITTFERDVGVIMMNNSTKQFYLPRNIQHYNEYYDLLNFPNDILNILKLTIGKKNHKGFPIIKVEVPNRQERLQVITNLLSSEKNADEDIDYSTPENTCAEILVDNISLLNFPNEDPKTQDGDIKIAMGISARAFYLPKNIHTDHPEYYDLLTADRKPNILKLTLGNTTNKGIPIINVELPDETSTAYLKVKERREYFQAQEE